METAAKPNFNSCFLAFCFGFVYRVLNLTRATTLLQVTTIVIWKLPQVIKYAQKLVIEYGKQVSYHPHFRGLWVSVSYPN